MDLPKFEALNLDEPDFIVDPDAQNVCVLPLPIFTRISEMLSPCDFVHLAQTCRYMHWRMFTYGHLMLKNYLFGISGDEEEIKIEEFVTIDGKEKYKKIIIFPPIFHRPYVYIEYLYLVFASKEESYSPSMFDTMIDYVSKAKKRIKNCCIEILTPEHICTQQTFQDINNLIERINPLRLHLMSSWNDHKLNVEIPNLKNIYSVELVNKGYSVEFPTEFYMNPCATYVVGSVQDVCNIIQEFTKNSRLQFHLCITNTEECRAMLEKEWNLKFEEADETLRNSFPPTGDLLFDILEIPLYASIPSEHGDVEIFIKNMLIVVQRKESYVGQWKDFNSKVKSPLINETNNPCCIL